MKFNFRVRGVPVPEGNLRVRPARGRMPPKIYHANSVKLIAWREAIAWMAAEAAKEAGLAELHDGPVQVRMVFLLPRPQRHPKKNGPLFAQTKPDLDKLARAVLDALEGVVYKNDSRVVDISARKAYAAESPGVGIEVDLMGAKAQ